MAASPRDPTRRPPHHHRDLLLRILGHVVDRAIPELSILARHAFRACIRTGKDVLAACRVRSGWAGRCNGASWTGRGARRLCVAPHRR